MDGDDTPTVPISRTQPGTDDALAILSARTRVITSRLDDLSKRITALTEAMHMASERMDKLVDALTAAMTAQTPPAPPTP